MAVSVAFVACALLLGSVLCHDPSLHADQENVPDPIHTDHWTMSIPAGVSPELIAEQHGHRFLGKVRGFKDVYLFEKHPDTVHGVTHPHHHENPSIEWADQQVARHQQKRITLTDPLYPNQWHLHPLPALNNANVHLNIVPAWDAGYNGKGVVVAVVDDGCEYTHPDLAPNYNASLSWDYNFNDSNPFPDFNSDDHGTSASGCALAAENSNCGVGTGHKATLSCVRLLARATTDYQEGGALGHATGLVDIYSNSWGPTDDGKRKEGPGRLAALAIQNGIAKGRGGKGALYVWAGGNGRKNLDNCNYDGWVNWRYTIAVAASDTNGAQAWYSEECSALTITAPSSGGARAITTTDLLGKRGTSDTECTSTFGGTSAAAPMAAGAISLVVQARPELTWRDVQEVLIVTATRNDGNNPSWYQNGANKWFSHKYGFGMLNTWAAVQYAKNCTLLPPNVSVNGSRAVGRPIPDNTPAGVIDTMNITAPENFTIEHIEMYFVATHPRRGDLRITLTSPMNTNSYLAEPHRDTNANYNWRFGSLACWGEKADGTWTLRVADAQANLAGTWTSWSLIIYGHIRPYRS